MLCCVLLCCILVLVLHCIASKRSPPPAIACLRLLKSSVEIFFAKMPQKKTPLFAQRVNIFGSDKAGNSLIINTSPFMRFLPQHAMPEAIELLKSCKTMAPSSKANNAKKLLLLEISYFFRAENTTKHLPLS